MTANVLEPPSPELMKQLTELQLCRPSDLRRARGRVRRLAYDLTAFDSVWIDSLVQLRLLTLYQAHKFEQGQADQLRLGSFVVIDELGRSPRGSTLLARRLQRRDRCVVKRQQIDSNRLAEVSRLTRLVMERSAGFAHPLLVLPHEILPTEHHELVTVSRYVPGLPLNELLVRRGRFPASVVLDIGRQLLEGLAALHARSLVHGDIRMSNVRLTDFGMAVLVDGAIRPVIHPEITIHNTLSLEAYDGLAPELIGTGAPPSASSELYAVGCLLWQLLAGRPPFTTADPLAKIAAHQTKTIDDVRVWAPETPVALAEMIRRMTAPAPQSRPRSFDEVLQRWGRAGSFGRSRLRQFRRLFNGAVPHFGASADQVRSSGLIWTAAALFAFGGGVAMLYESGLRAELLQVVQQVRSVARGTNPVPEPTSKDLAAHSTDGQSRVAEFDRGPLPLPEPSADGVILLNEHGPYEATSVTFAGNLTIRGAFGVKAEILVDDVPLGLSGQSVTLEQMTVRCVNDTAPTTLTNIRSQQLTVQNCVFVVENSAAEVTEANPSLARGTVSLAWAFDPRDAKAGMVSIKNTAFHGTGAAILLRQTPRSVTVVNSLKTGLGAFASLGPKCQAAEMRLAVDHVTLRGTGPLLRLAGEPASKIGTSPVQIDANECVFSLADARSGLVVIDCERPRADLIRCVQMTSSDSIVVPDTALLTKFDAERSKFHEQDADDQFEGLSANGVEFAGPISGRAGDSETARLLGPRVAATVDRLPGIDSRQIGPGSRDSASQQPR